MEPPIDYGKLMSALAWWNALPEILKIDIWEDIGDLITLESDL